MIELMRGVLYVPKGNTRASFTLARRKNGRVSLLFKVGWDSHLAKPEYAFLGTHPSDWHESRKNNAEVLLELALAPLNAAVRTPIHWNGFYYHDTFQMEWRKPLAWDEKDRLWLERRNTLEKLAEGT